MKNYSFIKLAFLLLTSIVSSLSFASVNTNMSSDSTQFKFKEPVDSLVMTIYRNKEQQSYNTFFKNFITLDEAYLAEEEGKSKDEIYKERLNLIPSSIRLPYNSQIRILIDNSINPRYGMGPAIGRAIFYMPLIEKELEANGLPLELKIIPLIESRFNPGVTSSAGASGLWQFMYNTGKHYGLNINSLVDERFDPTLSTRAACKYLKTLYNMYGDWTLVLAAYSCGSGNVNKTLKRVPNAKDFWDIYHYLPNETRNFIPSFVAANYTFNFYKYHDIKIVMPKHPIYADTVMITNKIINLNHIAEVIDVPIETLRSLNPMYKRDILHTPNHSRSLTLPTDKICNFIDHEVKIYADAEKYTKDITVEEKNPTVKGSYVTYSVRKGDLLGNIARQHKVKTSDILKWNNIKDARKIKIGQKLKIFI